jgi:hypothetical protein
MKRSPRRIATFAVTALAAFGTVALSSPPPPHAAQAARRTFRMGFTGFVPDITPEAVAASRKFVRENADLIAHHIEGVPWTETLHDAAFPPKLLEEWTGKKSSVPPNGKVYLAVSPGRGDLKVADHCAPLAAELRGKAYDDPLVVKTYLSYCRRAIAFFQPDYLCIGIEVNEIQSSSAASWRAYKELHRQTYAALKKDHAAMPIFASFTLHNLFKHRGAMLSELKALMAWNDFAAISYYPFFMEPKDRLSALDWLLAELDPLKKPYAVVETNDAAARLELPASRFVIDGTPEKQRDYYRRLLELAEARRFEFVVSFVHQDYDRLWDKIRATAPELFMAWRDCGLIDENGVERPAFAIWKDAFARPLAPGR